VALSLPLVALTNQKSLPYPIYNVGTNLNAHVWVFMKASKAMGKGMI
jgi:hypothetical protein